MIKHLILNLGRSVPLLILIAIFLTGCTFASVRLHPEFSSFRQSMAVMLVLPPEIGVFEKMPDGSRLYQDIQSREAQDKAQLYIVQDLQARGFSVKTVDAATMRQPDYASIASLFRSVNRAIQLHTLGPQPFPAKLSAFEYNLGSVAEILKANHADGLVLTLGHQTGADPPDNQWLSMAVVEPEGRIIWYDMQGLRAQVNYRGADPMATTVADTLSNFWEPGS